MLKDLVKSCRSYRRFYEDISIPQEELTDMSIRCALQAAQPTVSP